MMERVQVLADDWVEAGHTDHGFTLCHPPDWRALQGWGDRPLVLVGPGAASRPVIQAAAPLAPADTELDGYVALQLESMGRLLTDLRLLGEEPARVSHFDGRRLLVTYRQGIYLLNMVVWTALGFGRALSVSGICVATDYDRIEPTFSSIVTSACLTTAAPGGTP